MGKTLVIKGADFSAVAVDRLEDKVINFTSATVKNHNIAESSGVLKLVTPTTGNPSFYEIDCQGYNNLEITCDGSRIFISNAKLPTSATSNSGVSIEGYCAGTKANSYYPSYTGTNSIINLPNNSKYLYIRKTASGGNDSTPSSATLKAM